MMDWIMVGLAAFWLLLGAAFYYPARVLWKRRWRNTPPVGWWFIIFGPACLGPLLIELTLDLGDRR